MKGRGKGEGGGDVRLVAKHPEPLTIDPVAWRQVLVGDVGGVEVLEAADVVLALPLGVAGGLANCDSQ
jgi:hypothetical protein